MKPLKWYIAQAISAKIIEDIKAKKFDIDHNILIQTLKEYGTRTK